MAKGKHFRKLPRLDQVSAEVGDLVGQSGAGGVMTPRIVLEVGALEGKPRYRVGPVAGAGVRSWINPVSLQKYYILEKAKAETPRGQSALPLDPMALILAELRAIRRELSLSRR